MDFDHNTLVRGVLLGRKTNNVKFEVNGSEWKIENIFARPGLRKFTDEGNIVYCRTRVQSRIAHSVSYSPRSKEEKYGFRGPVLQWNDAKFFEASDIDSYYSEKIDDKDVKEVFLQYRYYHEICSLEMMKKYFKHVMSIPTDGQPLTLNQWLYNTIYHHSGEQDDVQTKACFRPSEEYEPLELPVGVDFASTDLQFFQAAQFRSLANANLDKATLLGSSFRDIDVQGTTDFMDKVKLYTADIRFSHMVGVTGHNVNRLEDSLTKGCVWNEEAATSDREIYLEAFEALGGKMDEIDYKVDGMRDKMVHKMDEMGVKLDEIGVKMDGMHGKLDDATNKMGAKVDEMSAKMDAFSIHKEMSGAVDDGGASDVGGAVDAVSTLAGGDGYKISAFYQPPQPLRPESVDGTNAQHFTVIYEEQDIEGATRFLKKIEELGYKGNLHDGFGLPGMFVTDCLEIATDKCSVYFVYASEGFCKELGPERKANGLKYEMGQFVGKFKSQRDKTLVPFYLTSVCEIPFILRPFGKGLRESNQVEWEENIHETFRSVCSEDDGSGHRLNIAGCADKEVEHCPVEDTNDASYISSY